MSAGCASIPTTSPQFVTTASITSSEAQTLDAQASGDPLEKTNRSVLENNQSFYQSVIYPISDAYRDTVPEPVRNSISNFTSNLGEPIVFANNVLQGRMQTAVGTAGRFLVNSTIGLGGLFDVAKDQSLPKQTGDFGQTLYVWGIYDSPYLVLPLVGPTNVRDAVGSGIELAATAVPASAIISSTRLASSFNNVSNIGSALKPFSSLDRVSDLRELEKGSLDFYALLRSAAEQKRDAELRQAVNESGFYVHDLAPSPYNSAVAQNAKTPVSATASVAAALPGGEPQRAGSKPLQGGKIVIGGTSPTPSTPIVIGANTPTPVNASFLAGEKIVIGGTPAGPDGKIVIGPSRLLSR